MRRKKAEKRPWWETGVGEFSEAELAKLRRDAERFEAGSEAVQRMRKYRHLTALSEYFNDGAPSEWMFAIVIVGVDVTSLAVTRLDIIGPANGPAYGDISPRFRDAIGDYAGFAVEFGSAPVARFALERAGRAGTRWHVIVSPGERFMRYTMNGLGYAQWDASADEFLGTER